ncbi:hypothetical protein [Streptomyces roseus]|uniref:Uncharacterized protein n=1 Tax=Streptomyces roseus TaxID=66430 RepID=A0A0J7AIP8_9ACTN|nr:hypothetical protein ACS04_14985 [Streptomyces roseus]
MSHETPPVPLRYGEAVLYPPAVPEPQMLPAEMPPGVQVVTLPSGARTLAYTSTAPTEPAPVLVQRIPMWAKTTALLAPTVGGGIGAASVGLAYAAPGLIALTEALWAAVALIAAGGAALFLGRTRRASASTHITQHITATGLFGRATGSVGRR